MSFPYDTPFTNNNKVDRNTFPAVPDINKFLATETNVLISGVNALATAVTNGAFLGLIGGESPAVAPTGGTRLKSGAAGLEVSFSGGPYQEIDLTYSSVGLVLGCTGENTWGKVYPKAQGAGLEYNTGTEQVFPVESLASIVPVSSFGDDRVITADPAFNSVMSVGIHGPWTILNIGEYSITYNTGTYLTVRHGTVTLAPGDSLTVYCNGAGTEPAVPANFVELSRSIA